MAAAAADGPSMKLQIVVDKKKNRVMFAEANKDFVDFIFHILSLPIGSVQMIIAKNTPSTCLGSIGTLEVGLKKLDAKYMEDPAKDYILNHLKAPYRGKNTTLLLPVTTRSGPIEFHQCSHDQIVRVDSRCPHAYNQLGYPNCSRQVKIEGYNKSELALVHGYVKEAATFMVMDDLVVRPAEPASVISLMKEHLINDVGHIDKMEVTFGTAEAMKLINASVSSKTVLTDVFLYGAVKTEN